MGLGETHDSPIGGGALVSTELFTGITVFVLALLVGFEVISKIPSTLHTPMMSGANAIHGVVIVGAILTATAADTPIGYLLAGIASRVRRGQRGRRLPRDRSDAADVPGAEEPAGRPRRRNP